MPKPFNTLEHQLAIACRWMPDAGETFGASFCLQEILSTSVSDEDAAQRIAERIVEELQFSGHGRAIEASFQFACACKGRARDAEDATRLDHLAQLINEHRELLKSPEVIVPVEKARETKIMFHECEALLRELRSACAMAGFVTEPPMTDQEAFEETAGGVDMLMLLTYFVQAPTEAAIEPARLFQAAMMIFLLTAIAAAVHGHARWMRGE